MVDIDHLHEIHSLEEKGTRGSTLMYGLVECKAVKQSTKVHVSIKLSSSYREIVCMGSNKFVIRFAAEPDHDNKGSWQEHQCNKKWQISQKVRNQWAHVVGETEIINKVETQGTTEKVQLQN